MLLLIITGYGNTDKDTWDFQNKKSSDHLQMAASYSSVETMKTFVTMEIIIHLIIWDSFEFTRHNTVDDIMVKRRKKLWTSKIFYET